MSFNLYRTMSKIIYFSIHLTSTHVHTQKYTYVYTCISCLQKLLQNIGGVKLPSKTNNIYNVNYGCNNPKVSEKRTKNVHIDVSTVKKHNEIKRCTISCRTRKNTKEMLKIASKVVVASSCHSKFAYGKFLKVTLWKIAASLADLK